MGVDVAARDAGNAEQPRALGQLTAQRAVMARERALKFDPQIVAAEGCQQAAQARLVVEAVASAAAEADQALGVGLNLFERQLRLPALAAVAGVRVGERQKAAEVAPALGVLDQQR